MGQGVRAMVAAMAAATLMAAAAPAAAAGGPVRCGSPDNRYRECYARFVKPKLAEATGPAACIRDRSWGYNFRTKYIWVSNGCAGVFYDARGPGYADVIPPPAYPKTHPDYGRTPPPPPPLDPGDGYYPRSHPDASSYGPPPRYDQQPYIDPVQQQALAAQKERDRVEMEALKRRLDQEEAQRTYERVQAEMNRPRPGIPQIKPIEISPKDLDPFGSSSDDDMQPPTASRIPGMVCDGEGDDASCDAR